MVDSLQVFEILKAGKIPEEQARAMTQAIQKAERDVTTDMRAWIHAEFDSFGARLEARFDAKLAETKAELLRWNFAFWVTQLAAMAAILKLLK
jgi:hypothetical protein